ncbi:MAG: zinc-dependent metalloprotease [Actinomycetales bacterium]|nr:zinc-dependent metalloprotease [Actinomycetales bacterium]
MNRPAAGDSTIAGVDDLIDWGVAASTAGLVTRSGPMVSAEAAAELVQELRDCSAAAVGHVERVSGLSAPLGPPALVVARSAWVTANLGTFRLLLDPVVSAALDRRERPLPAQLRSVGSRVTGVELGSVLGFLASRVLGQFDPFGVGPGRLMLVAPNVVKVEQELEVVPGDFRLWVCLHEETHRVQFGVTPWLAEHLLTEVRGLVGDLLADPGAMADRLTSLLRGLPDVVRGEGTDAGLLDAVQTPEQRERLAAVTAVMSLLEGHADVVMDEVGPQVVPTVAEIRERFGRRRGGRGAVDRLLRRLIGLDAKMRQYANGARFVREVTDRVGRDGFNAVWSSPENLPRPAEIVDPSGWVRRVHG